MKRMRGRGGVYEEGVFLISWCQIELQKNTKIKYDKGLRWLPFHFFHALTNQKHVGVMEGGWYRPHNRARSLGERDGNNKGNKDDDDKYGKDGDIPDEPFDFFTQQPTKNTRA